MLSLSLSMCPLGVFGCSSVRSLPRDTALHCTQAYVLANNGHYVAAERNHSLVTQRFRPGIARGDSFILEVGTTHCNFRSQYNRYASGRWLTPALTPSFLPSN
jgi:hypothetical protein